MTFCQKGEWYICKLCRDRLLFCLIWYVRLYKSLIEYDLILYIYIYIHVWYIHYTHVFFSADILRSFVKAYDVFSIESGLLRWSWHPYIWLGLSDSVVHWPSPCDECTIPNPVDEKILLLLGCIKPYEQWDTLRYQWTGAGFLASTVQYAIYHMLL